MVRIRHGWLAIAMSLVVGGAACKKDDSKTGDKADKGDKAGGSTSAGGVGDDLSLLPVDSEMVLGLNFSQLQGSQLWKTFVEPKMMTGDAVKKFAEFKDKCGFDPMSAVKTVSVGLKGLNSKQPEGAFVIHGAEKDKVLSCLDKMKDEITKDGTEYTRDGDVALFKDKNGPGVAITFINDTTALGTIGTAGTKDGVKAAAAGGSALKTSPAFVDMYGKINTNDSLWLLMNGNSKLFDKAAAMGVKPKALFGSLNVTDGLTVDFRMRVDTPDQAKQFADMAQGQLKQAEKMFDKISITNEGNDIKLSVVLSNQKLQALIQQVGSMMSAFGGMGGGGMGGP
jgi:hypothetical protein